MIGEKLGADAIRYRIADAVSSIETMFIGTIRSIDTINMKYNVQPTLNKFDVIDSVDVSPPILFECPMMASKCADFIVRLPYAVGDMVYVGCSKHSVDEAITSNEPHPNRMSGVRSFRIIDGVILGGIVSDIEDRMPSNNGMDFLIQNRKTKCKMVMLKSGGFEFETTYDIKTKSANFSVEAKDNFNVKCTNANIEASSGVSITTPNTAISGNASVGGNLGVTGGMTGSGSLKVSGASTVGSITTANGVTLDGHTHTYNPGPSPPTNTATGKG